MTMLKEHFGDEIDFVQNYIYRFETGMRIPRNFVHINIPHNGETPRNVFNTEIDKGKKSVFYSFIVGMILGGGGIYCLLNISTPARATMTVSSSDPDTKITGEHLEVKTNGQLVSSELWF